MKKSSYMCKSGKYGELNEQLNGDNLEFDCFRYMGVDLSSDGSSR